MKLRVAQVEKRWPSPWEAYSLVVLLGAAVYIPLSYMTNWMPSLHSPLRYSGAACPLCGGTRAVTALMTGQLALAVKYNPLALVIFALFIWSLISYVFLVLPFKRRVVIQASKPQRRVLWGVVILAFVANWAYVFHAGMYNVPLELKARSQQTAEADGSNPRAGS